MLGQTNSGINTSEIDARIDSLDTRISNLEITTRKYYVKYTPPKAVQDVVDSVYEVHYCLQGSEGDQLSYYTKGPNNNNFLFNYTVKQNGTTVMAGFPQGNAGNNYYTQSGYTTDSTVSVDYGTPIDLQIEWRPLTFSSAYGTNGSCTLKVFKFNTLIYSKKLSTDSNYTIPDIDTINLSFNVDRNIKLFDIRNVVSNTASVKNKNTTSLNIYIDEL